jgi:hypothetical protein
MKRKPARRSKKTAKKPRDLKAKGSVRGGGREQNYYSITLANAAVANTSLTNASLRNR